MKFIKNKLKKYKVFIGLYELYDLNYKENQKKLFEIIKYFTNNQVYCLISNHNQELLFSLKQIDDFNIICEENQKILFKIKQEKYCKYLDIINQYLDIIDFEFYDRIICLKNYNKYESFYLYLMDNDGPTIIYNSKIFNSYFVNEFLKKL